MSSAGCVANKQAVHGDGHFGALGNGCGVSMMNENIRPGDHLLDTRSSQCRIIGFLVLKVLAFIIFSPLILVFYVPCMEVHRVILSRRGRDHCCILVIKCVFAFLGGLLLDIIFIPVIIIYAVVLIGYAILRLINCIITCRCLFLIIRQCRRGDAPAPEPRLSWAARRN